MEKNIFAFTSVKILVIVLAALTPKQLYVNAHGRLWEPPGRSTLWRLEEFQNLESPPLENYDDDQLYCGGIGKLLANGGKCGACGDEWGLPKPRDNENGGMYGRGVITRHYTKGQKIDVAVELTANHWGYFEFRICPLQHSKMAPEPDDCFDNNVLPLGDGSRLTRYNVTTDQPGWFNTSVILPAQLTGRAVLQWHYKAGNTWNPCENERGDKTDELSGVIGSTSCGYQEIFRGCSDIYIHTSNTNPVSSTASSPTQKPALAGGRPPGFDTPSSKPNQRPKPTIPPMRPPKVPS